MQVLIRGAGVAGSYLAYLLADKGFDVTFTDVKLCYRKPCGCAVPREVIEVLPWSVFKDFIVNKISGFKVYFPQRGVVKEFRAKEVLGYIIAKDELICYLRREAIEKGASLVLSRKPKVLTGATLEVVATGPFTPASGGDRIPLVQGIAINVSGLEDDLIHMWFFNDKLGYYWAFPMGGSTFNVGFGMVGGVDVVTVFSELTGKLLPGSSVRVFNVRTAPMLLSVPSPGCRRCGKLFIGEAGGFIMCHTGEGIRPALMSATVVADALISRRDPWKALEESEVYKMCLRSYKIYVGMKLLGPKDVSEILSSLDEDEFISLFNAATPLVGG